MNAYAPDLLTRADVRVSREYGWVVHKQSDYIVGCVWSDTNPLGKTIYRAAAGDIQTWAEKREDAVQDVLDLHNMQEKARAYDLLTRLERVS